MAGAQSHEALIVGFVASANFLSAMMTFQNTR